MRRTLAGIGYMLLALMVGMAAVSAFESHVINVSAKVSNSLTLTAPLTTLGTPASPLSPLTWKNIPITVSLSASFQAQTLVSNVAYQVCAQPKPNTHPGTLTDLGTFTFLWMGGSSFLEFETDNAGPFHWIGPATDITPPSAGVVCPAKATNSLNKLTDISDALRLWYEVPVFSGFYNPADPDTGDTAAKPRNDLADCGARTDTQPCVILPIPPASIGGTTLGLDLVVQVIAIN